MSPAELIRGTAPQKKRLNQWLATAICGNDITSSCLYVAAIASVYAGVLAPLVLLMVGGVLYLYKIFPSLKVELVVREDRFGPEIIETLSREFGVLKNNMFIGAPEEKHNFSIQDLGGVRIMF